MIRLEEGRLIVCDAQWYDGRSELSNTSSMDCLRIILVLWEGVFLHCFFYLLLSIWFCFCLINQSIVFAVLAYSPAYFRSCLQQYPVSRYCPDLNVCCCFDCHFLCVKGGFWLVNSKYTTHRIFIIICRKINKRREKKSKLDKWQPIALRRSFHIECGSQFIYLHILISASQSDPLN